MIRNNKIVSLARLRGDSSSPLKREAFYLKIGQVKRYVPKVCIHGVIGDVVMRHIARLG